MIIVTPSVLEKGVKILGAGGMKELGSEYVAVDVCVWTTSNV